MTNPSNPSDSPDDKPVDNPEIEDFFQRLPSNFRFPKPSAEAVAAAVEAVNRMSGGPEAAQGLASSGTEEPSGACAMCGVSLPPAARFCAWCGVPRDAATSGAATQPSGSPALHHFHHHYHHHFAPSSVPSSGAEPESTLPRGRAPGAPGPAPGGRAEIAARQVVQDWAQACNTKHIDDLVELYAADATLIRSSVPPVRSLPAIREFLLSMLEAGLGDVEMESLRLEMLGEIAMDLGRCKMLVPVAMGRRREERGKYLIVLVRQPAGTWKILADCWSTDLPVMAHSPAEPASRKGSEPSAPVRKPR